MRSRVDAEYGVCQPSSLAELGIANAAIWIRGRASFGCALQACLNLLIRAVMRTVRRPLIQHTVTGRGITGSVLPSVVVRVYFKFDSWNGPELLSHPKGPVLSLCMPHLVSQSGRKHKQDQRHQVYPCTLCSDLGHRQRDHRPAGTVRHWLGPRLQCSRCGGPRIEEWVPPGWSRNHRERWMPYTYADPTHPGNPVESRQIGP